jgi:hypothetical protein
MVFIASRPPYHRQNRRRERPGARTRKALSMRDSIQHDFEEGISVARDCGLWLPSEKYPLRNCDCWRAENDRSQLEDEQFRIFGGDVGDDVSLLPAMLEVVRFLWGDIDYIDP